MTNVPSEEDFFDLRDRVDTLEREFRSISKPETRPATWLQTEKVAALRAAWNAYTFRQNSSSLSALGEAVVAICGRRS